MKNVNVLDPESLAEYRRDVVRSAQQKSDALAKIPIDMIVDNPEMFTIVWLTEHEENWTGFPDLWDIFKPYGHDVFNAMCKTINEVETERIKKYDRFAYEKYDEKEKEYRRTFSPKQRFEIMKRDNYRCVICGRNASDGVKLHVDHVFPKSKGGLATYENGATLCQECNIGKTNSVLEVSYLEIIGTHIKPRALE